MPDRCVNCGSTDPFPRRRVMKLAFGVLVAIAVVAASFYFYERAKYLQLAEEKAKAVEGRVYDTRPAAVDPITGEAVPAGQ